MQHHGYAGEMPEFGSPHDNSSPPVDDTCTGGWMDGLAARQTAEEGEPGTRVGRSTRWQEPYFSQRQPLQLRHLF